MSTNDTEYKFVDFGKRRGFDQIAPDHLIKMIDDNLIEQKQTVNIIFNKTSDEGYYLFSSKFTCFHVVQYYAPLLFFASN